MVTENLELLSQNWLQLGLYKRYNQESCWHYQKFRNFSARSATNWHVWQLCRRLFQPTGGFLYQPI